MLTLITSDTESVNFVGSLANNGGVFAQQLNAGRSAATYQIFTGNPSTGSGASLAPPGSCGPRTQIANLTVPDMIVQ
jgi:hypothetical protein